MIDKNTIHTILLNKLGLCYDNERLIAIGDEIYDSTPHLGQIVYALVREYSAKARTELYQVVRCKITSTRLNKDGTPSFSVEGHYLKDNYYSDNTYQRYYQANFKHSSIGKSVFLGPKAEQDADCAMYKKNIKIMEKKNDTV